MKLIKRTRTAHGSAAFTAFIIAACLAFTVLVSCSGEQEGDTAENGGGPSASPVPEAEKQLHPEFSVDRAALSSITADLPAQIQKNILDAPSEFLDGIIPVLREEAEFTVLIDKTHPLAPDYEPSDLAELDGTGLSLGRGGQKLRRPVLIDLTAMSEAAEQEGITLLISSAYRSYAYQAGVYERNVQALGKEEADRVSAEPGKSQHQLGTAVDFGSITPEYADTPAGKWLKMNGWKYGFSMSYPEGMEDLTGYMHECWHFRYITPEAAALEQRYFEGVQQYMLEFLESRGPELARLMKTR